MAELIKLMRYGKGGKGRLGSLGFINLCKLKIPRRYVNLIRKRFCRRLGRKFELNRGRKHMVWRGDELPSHIRFRTPRPQCSFKNLTENYPGEYVNERSGITPKNVHAD